MPSPAAPILIVHGGAGRGRPQRDEQADADLRRDLRRALEAGWRRLAAGAEAACVAAVSVLEDSPHFNAGTGSALAADGGVWCDASLMCGDGRAGAVAGVQGIRFPVSAAQALAHAGPPPLLWAGRSTELAARYGLALIDPARMVTERQRRRLERRLGHQREAGAEAGGTVGAVCLDATGALAAATSTGGYAAKPPARVGDAAIIGAGTWADARTCAVSATGDGEAFMRTAFAHEIHARMLHAGEGLAQAAGAALAAVRDAGGLGGAICVGVDGMIATPVSSEVMARGWRRGEEIHIALGGESA